MSTTADSQGTGYIDLCLVPYTMQFDPDRKFGELHKDSKALHDVIEEIIDVALVEAPPDNQTLDIRFVTPRDRSADWHLNEKCAEYELTPPGIRTRYVAVSYCWSNVEP
jgi:hypothetical protein